MAEEVLDNFIGDTLNGVFNWRVGNNPPALTGLEPEYEPGGRLRGVSHLVNV